jgi:hypothetical protein
MRKKRFGTCTYCGVEGPVTRDHLPSKNLFVSGDGVNFRFVDSCAKCNQGYSQDEEFLRNWFANAHYESSEEATKLFDGPITRAYKERPSLAGHFFNRMQLIETYNPGTGFSETKTALFQDRKDKSRISRIIKKYTIGLCRWHFGSRLNPGLQLKVTQVGQRWLNSNSDILNRMTLNIVKESVFEYKYGQVPNSQQSMWVLQFYGGSYFLVFVANEDFFLRKSTKDK